MPRFCVGCHSKRVIQCASCCRSASASYRETRLIEAAACVRRQLVWRLMEVAAVFGKLRAYFPRINDPNKSVNKTFFLP